MPLTSRWMHGNVVEVEVGIGERRAVEVIRRGWGTHFLLGESGRPYWFHFPIPTLSAERRVNLTLRWVCVCFTTDGTVVRAIHVYDGPTRVMEREDLHIVGDHSRGADPHNSWQIDPPIPIERGVGISVGVEVVHEGRFGFPEILFTTAGAEFESPRPAAQGGRGGSSEVF